MKNPASSCVVSDLPSLDAYLYPHFLLNGLEEEKKGRKMTCREMKI
jgi:hypothetical protein